MTFKRIPFLLLALVLTASACAPAARDCARDEVFCVGLVTSSGSIDEGINQQAWLGLQDAKNDGGIDRIDYIETIDSRDRLKNIEALAADGYDLIVTVGGSITDETAAAAQQFPQTAFMGVEQSQGTIYPNLTGLVFHEEQGGFLAGALAASLTQTGRIGAVCEAKFIEQMRRYCDGFQAGANYINPGINVSVIYRDGPQETLFHDTAWGQNTAAQLLNEGVDVLFAAGGETGDAALEAAAAQDAYVIGAETDVYARLPAVRPKLVTSAVNEVRSGVRDLTRKAYAGDFPSGEFFGQIGLAPFRRLQDHIPLGLLNRVPQIEAGLRDSSIQVNVPFDEK